MKNHITIILSMSMLASAFCASDKTPYPFTNHYEAVYVDGGKHLLRIDGNHEGEFVVAEGTEQIGKYAFSRCREITSVIIPDSVTNIMERAFEYCSSLTNVVFGSGLREIGIRTFIGCEKIKQIDLPDSLETIRHGAFLHTPSKITIGTGLRNVGLFAFGYYQTLTTNSVHKIISISPNNQWLHVDGIQVVPIQQ